MTNIVGGQYILTDAALVDQPVPVLGEVLGDIRPGARMVIAGLIRLEMRVGLEVTASKG